MFTFQEDLIKQTIRLLLNKLDATDNSFLTISFLALPSCGTSFFFLAFLPPTNIQNLNAS